MTLAELQEGQSHDPRDPATSAYDHSKRTPSQSTATPEIVNCYV